jgi:hypothetical protein
LLIAHGQRLFLRGGMLDDPIALPGLRLKFPAKSLVAADKQNALLHIGPLMVIVIPTVVHPAFADKKLVQQKQGA